jgi:TusE/DsrC/DsvC family sulfur relay protein
MITQVGKTWLEFDEDGFLMHPEAWDETVATAIAQLDGIGELTPAHWEVINALREEYKRLGAPSGMRHVCHINHLDKHCVENLFDHKPREAWRIAGLPNPGEEAKAYM